MAPLVLLVLPADFFDNGQTVCLSVLLFNIKCYGCGITRAVQHLIHFDFATAWEYNKLVVAVVPLLLIVWVQELIRVRKLIKTWP
ncbi:MAG: DUF2752 domain-containing protein [Sphingobacteriales bacterium JAD_PAG50586_3]|nr:MAG: DUF2752 domain-containing protein [Sphingobacteriales bacterium JAD_PAG50586_3]